jgi:hypothetical protein
MLSQIPVYAVMVEDLGERGAHYMAYKEFCKEMYVPVKAEPVIPEYVGAACDKPDSPMPVTAASYDLSSNFSRSSDSKEHSYAKESKRSLNNTRMGKYFRLKKLPSDRVMKTYDPETHSVSSHSDVWVEGYNNSTITLFGLSILGAFVYGSLRARI